MSLRKRAFHDTAVMQRHAGIPVDEITDFREGDRVMTIDGFPGKVTAVLYGPFQNTENYQVELDGGMGGGDYGVNQLSKITERSAARVEAADVTASIPFEATTDHTANMDYPELENILTERLPNENIKMFASKVARNTDEMGGNPANDDDSSQQLVQDQQNPGVQGETQDVPEQDPQPKDVEQTGPDHGIEQVEPPHACSFCGHDQFEDPQVTGRGMRMRCAQCKGTMKSWGGQWEPEFPNSSQNHASETWDYRSGGPGGVVQAPGVHFKNSALSAVNSMDTRSVVESLQSEAGIVSWMFNRMYEKARQKYEDKQIDWWMPEQNQLDTEIVGPAHYEHLIAPNIVHTGSASSLDDPDWTWHFTASWMDVQEKARRIRKSAGVKIIAASKSYVNAEVEGDQNTYETQLNYVPGTKKVADWSCGCKWSSYAWGRSKNFKRFEGRLCSHALATQYEANAQGIFGREVSADPRKWQDDGKPIIVQHERGYGDHSRPSTVPNIRRTFSKMTLDSDGVYPDEHQIDLQHAPVYAAVQTMIEKDAEWSDVLSFVASTGMPREDARAMVVEAVVSTFKVEGYSVPAPEAEEGSALTSEGSKQAPRRKRKPEPHDQHPFTWLHSYLPGHGPCPTCAGIGCGNCNAGQVPLPDSKPGGSVEAGGEGMSTTAASHDAFDYGHDAGYSHASHGRDESGAHMVASSWHNPMEQQDVVDGYVHGHSTWHNEEEAGLPHKGGSIKEADYSAGEFGAGMDNASGKNYSAPHSNSVNPASTGWATSQDPGDWGRSLISNNFGITSDASLRFTAKGEPPTISGVALKAADTGRLLMIQRSHKDESDPAKGTWEFPGGHHEDGDQTSLHAGIREWEEETGQPFPQGGHLTHVHRSGPYLLHTVVTPNESDVDFSKGRSEKNPDDPDGDDHEQAAWWHPDHAAKNPALRSELKKSTPFADLKKAAMSKIFFDGKDFGEYVMDIYERSRKQAAEGQQSEAAIDFEARLTDATLNEEPEPALPSTDGADQDIVGDPGAGNTMEHDTADGMTNHTASTQDIIAEFQKSAGGRALAKEAMKDFSHSEQQELINEGKGGPRARNSNDLKIAGTHYEMLEDNDTTDDTILWV